MTLTKEYIDFLYRASWKMNEWYKQKDTHIDVNSWRMVELLDILDDLYEHADSERKEKYKELFDAPGIGGFC